MLPTIPLRVDAVAASSGNVAAASAVATLAASTEKTNFLTGFTVAGLGATAAACVLISVTGLVGGAQTFNFPVPAGVTVPAGPTQFNFPVPLAGIGPGTAIVVTVPSFGAGNTNASVTAYGFRL